MIENNLSLRSETLVKTTTTVKMKKMIPNRTVMITVGKGPTRARSIPVLCSDTEKLESSKARRLAPANARGHRPNKGVGV